MRDPAHYSRILPRSLFPHVHLGGSLLLTWRRGGQPNPGEDSSILTELVGDRHQAEGEALGQGEEGSSQGEPPRPGQLPWTLTWATAAGCSALLGNWGNLYGSPCCSRHRVGSSIRMWQCGLYLWSNHAGSLVCSEDP